MSARPGTSWASPWYGTDWRISCSLGPAPSRPGGAQAGIIGIKAGRAIKRPPSNVYWSGLGTWGIRLVSASQDLYNRSLDAWHLGHGRLERDNDGDPIAGAHRRNWDPGLPPAPAGLLREAKLDLTRPEANYLRDRILARHPRTLLAFLVDHGKSWEPTDYPWQHPQVGELPPTLIEQIEHARNFAETIHGATFLYNLMLAKKARNTELAEVYTEELTGWASELQSRGGALAEWDRARFWRIVAAAGASVTPRTRHFVDNWLDLALDPARAPHIAGHEAARRLIHDRERQLKRSKARLDNQRALERWSGAAGTGRNNYRWHRVQRIVLDVLEGLGRG